MIHKAYHSSNQKILECNGSIHIASENDQYMNGWLDDRRAHLTNSAPTKDVMVHNSDVISAYKTELHQHSRVSSSTSNDSTINNYCGIDTTSSSDGTSIINGSKQYSTNDDFPIQWNIEQVATWMKSVGLEALVDEFVDQKITGDVLLNLNNDSLKELGVAPYGHRFKALNAIDKLRYSQNDLMASDISFSQGRNRSVSENLLLIATKDNSTLNSHVSSRRANAKNAPHRVSLPSRVNTSGSDYTSSLMDRPYTVNPPKRSTLDRSVSQTDKLSSEGHLTLQTSISTPLSLLHPIEEQQMRYPQQQGWIYKQSKRYKTWNKRLFVLYDSNLFYFKRPTDSVVKGVINLQGYRVVLVGHVNSIKRYHFKLYHENERCFLFYTRTMDDMKMWVQALTKATITYNINAPTVSSNNLNTVPLAIAQYMKPRPPSTLMYSKKYNADSQSYQEFMEHSNMSEEALHKTLLWTKTPIQQELPPQKFISRPYTNNGCNQQNEKNDPQICQQQESQYVLDSLRKKEKLATDNNSAANNKLLHWVNSCISPELQILDLSQSMRTGVVLIQLLEALTGKTITRTQNQVTKSMIMLDNVVEAFKFMNQEGFVNNICTIKDVFCGDEEKIVELLLKLKIWAEDKYNIGNTPP